jgi:hypothetical protein
MQMGLEGLQMATPGTLVKTMSDVLGLPEATVTQYDRRLSESGLRSKSGRGSSAARVTARDAANLLIAILGSLVVGGSIKTAPAICSTFGDLRALNEPSWSARFTELGLPALGSMPSGHSFVEALTTLIGSAAGGETFTVPDGRTNLQEGFAFDLEVAGPDPSATIIAGGPVPELMPQTDQADLLPIIYMKHPLLMLFWGEENNRKGLDERWAHWIYSPSRDMPPASHGDLRQTRRITFTTIWTLGAMLAETGSA